MFDIGFFELMLIAIVGLVVIGPERLPETVRTVALWIGRIKRSVRQTRDQIEQQIGADDIRRQLHNEEVMQRLAEAEQSLNEATSFDGLEHKPVAQPAAEHEQKPNSAQEQQLEPSTSVDPEPLEMPELAEAPEPIARDEANKNS